MLMVMLTVLGIMPTNVFAQDSVQGENTANIPVAIEPFISDGTSGTAVLTQGMMLANALLRVKTVCLLAIPKPRIKMATSVTLWNLCVMRMAK